MNVECDCEDYCESMWQIENAQRRLLILTGIPYTGKTIVYCPWCGKKIKEDNYEK